MSCFNLPPRDGGVNAASRKRALIRAVLAVHCVPDILDREPFEPIDDLSQIDQYAVERVAADAIPTAQWAGEAL